MLFNEGSVITTLDDGTKIGIIGFVTPDTKDLASTGKIIFLDEVQSIERELAKLKREGVGIFVAVGHSGYEKDLEIAKEVMKLTMQRQKYVR